MATYNQLNQIGASLPISNPPIDVETFASLHGISAILQVMVEHTNQLFGNEVRVMLEEDPELPDDACFVLNVTTHGSVDDVLAKEDEWHARCVQLGNAASILFRLHVDVL